MLLSFDFSYFVMNKNLFSLAAAAALATTACTQDKPVETTTTAAVPADTAAIVTTDTTTYRSEADQLAARVAQDLKLTDTVVVTRIQKTYYTRGRRLNEVETRYAADTTGRYAALKQVNDDADHDVQAILPTAQYSSYAANRATYYDGTPYTVVAVAPAPVRRGPAIVKYEKDGGDVKIEYANGTKVKIDEDGERKTKFASGRKVKVDDDGDRKLKTASGRKVKVDDGERKVK